MIINKRKYINETLHNEGIMWSPCTYGDSAFTSEFIEPRL